MNISREITDFLGIKILVTQQFTKTLDACQGCTKLVADNRDEIALQFVHLGKLYIALGQLVITGLQCSEQACTFMFTPLTFNREGTKTGHGLNQCLLLCTIGTITNVMICIQYPDKSTTDMNWCQ